MSTAAFLLLAGTLAGLIHAARDAVRHDAARRADFLRRVTP